MEVNQHLSSSLMQLQNKWCISKCRCRYLKVNYPVFITDTKVGNGLTSVGVNASVVGIGTTFVDNVYIVKTTSENGENGEITCDVHTNSTSSISGINTVGFHSTGNPGMTTLLGQ